MTGTATAVAVLFIVVVALAGLGFAVVNALYYNAWGTFTIAMTIPIGFIMGFYLQKFRPGQVTEVSLLGVALLVAAVWWGVSSRSRPSQTGLILIVPRWCGGWPAMVFLRRFCRVGCYSCRVGISPPL